MLVPEQDDVDQIIGDVAAISALKGGFVAVEHGFKDREEGLQRHVDFDKGINDPCFWADIVLEFECVTFEQGNEFVDGKDGLGEVESRA